MVLYLVDTYVWRDFYANRFSKSGNPIGAYANQFFMKVIRHKDKIVFSKSLFWELNNDYSEEEIEDMLNLMIVCRILIRIDTTKEEISESKQLSRERNLPFMDCLNAIQARNHDAILITRDKHFFNYLSDVVKACRPEDIIRD